MVIGHLLPARLFPVHKLFEPEHLNDTTGGNRVMGRQRDGCVELMILGEVDGQETGAEVVSTYRIAEDLRVCQVAQDEDG